MAVAAYASVLSLMHVLDHVQHPSRRGLFLNTKKIETLREKVGFLQDFLEVHTSPTKINEIEELVRQIAYVADEAEDVIESHVVDQIRDQSEDEDQLTSFWSFCQDIAKIIEKIDSITKELMVVKDEKAVQQVQKPVSVFTPSGSQRLAASSGKKTTMVGFEYHLLQILDQLTGDQSRLQVISIVGMGGMGKTTLATNALNNKLIVERFDVRASIVVSQEYNFREVLLGLVLDIGGFRSNNEEEKRVRSEDVARLGERLHKSLFGKRYLILIDDVWSIEAWDDFKLFFPDNGNGSRIMVTTRMLKVADYLGSFSPCEMDFLDEEDSWNLFCARTFGGPCPSELEEIGKQIAKSCRGLPLAIVVIGGLLTKSNMTREYWELVAGNVNSFGNSGDDEHCLKILSLSYNQLPIHLKPCFLYMRVFPEDREVRVNELVRLWVGEGFLKPIGGKSLEEVAKIYLRDLIDRNLILIRTCGRLGRIRTCGVHDFIRDLCLRESHKEKFFSVPKVYHLGEQSELEEDTCFVCCEQSTQERMNLLEVPLGTRSTSLVSPLVCEACRVMYPGLIRLRLTSIKIDGQDFVLPTTLRYLSLTSDGNEFESLCSIALLWNLQTLVNRVPWLELPSEIWEMPQLRHLSIGKLSMEPKPLNEGKKLTILENLQTLANPINLRFTEDVIERIPNLKKFKGCYYKESEVNKIDRSYYYCLHNIARLHKLESLSLTTLRPFSMESIAFPKSLNKLKLSGCNIPWEDMEAVGSLPNLEVLKLFNNAFYGDEWNPIEGQFIRLKLLLIAWRGLVRWGADSIHFPALERLELMFLKDLEGIPLGIGEIATLRSIHLDNCSDSVVNSAQEIVEEQESFGNDILQVQVITQDRRRYQLSASYPSQDE